MRLEAVPKTDNDAHTRDEVVAPGTSSVAVPKLGPGNVRIRMLAFSRDRDRNWLFSDVRRLRLQVDGDQLNCSDQM